MTQRSLKEGLDRAQRGVAVAGPGRPGRPRERRQAGPSGRTLLAFATPAIVLLLLINLYPLIYAALQSVRSGTLIDTGDFVGLTNYGNVLSDPRFWDSAVFTVVFVLVGVFGSWAIGLGLALLLRSHIPGGVLFKVLLLLPWVVPVVVSATAWNWLVATPQSPIPVIASAIGLGNVNFLADPTLAQITVCVFKVWISFPFMMMMMSAALASVDKNVYEAAKMDGASRWRELTQITLPLISKTTYVSWVLMTIFCVNDFPTIYLLTGGGPVDATSTLVVLAYRTVFQEFDTGTGVSIAFLMTAVLIVVSVVLYRRIRKVNVA
ncbi:carbohydrate ABC transporter permease [Georgenia alba]|uniref:Carbohydrate ABC transporter permease n=1 Tax=Georgenia alba TaxID=2233858 RepID=A0ABW2QAR2_9MICO